MSAYASVLQKAIDRLTWHTASVAGRILSGIKFVPSPLVEIDGKSDLPQVRLFPNSASEKFVLRNPTSSAIEFKMQVGNLKDLGIPGAMNLLERAMDALETDTDGSIDATWNGLLNEPFSWRSELGVTVGQTIVFDAILSLDLAISPLRGQRRTIRYLVNGAGIAFNDGVSRPIAA